MQLHLPIPELSSCSRHDLPIPAWSCAVKHRPPFPTLWKLLHGTDAHTSHPGMKAASSSTTHGRAQYSCSRAQYFLSETKACCRLEEKEAVSFHTPSPSINQWDALQILLKHCFAFFFRWNILSPSLRSREGPWDFAMQVFVRAFSPAWSPDKVLLTHHVREAQQLPAPQWNPKEIAIGKAADPKGSLYFCLSPFQWDVWTSWPQGDER